jgi:hypothetical protein
MWHAIRQKEKTHKKWRKRIISKWPLRPVRYADENDNDEKEPGNQFFDGEDAENAKVWKKGAESRGYNAAL